MPARQVAVITGGGSGIGLATAEQLCAKGFAVLLAGRREQTLRDALEQVRHAVPDAAVDYRVTDVAAPDECEQVAAAAIDRFGGITALVTAAALYETVPFLDLTAETWDRTQAVTLRGAALCAVAAARRMRERGGGRIVLVGAVNARTSEPGGAHYNAAKAGVDSLARSIAVDLSADGIAVNAVLPGWVDTPMVPDDMLREDFRRLNPLARMGRPHELANVIAYLASEAPPFLTGSSIAVDGGQLAAAAMP